MARYVLAAAAALCLLAPTAWANWNVKAKVTCYEADGEKLLKEKGKNDNVVAACLGVAPTDPSVADHALTFDSDTSELHVLRRCDSLVICDLTNLVSCEVAGQDDKTGIDTKSACIYDMLDIGKTAVDGTLICKEKEKENFESGKFSFKASCEGALSYGGQPCALSFNTGKLFEESGTCPVAEP